MNKDDQAIETEILAKGLTAPSVTWDDIETNIASEHYFTGIDGVAGEAHRREIADVDPPFGWYAPPPLGLLTFCVLVLRNGFTVTGESACVSPENFDAELGRKIARVNAEQKIWPIMAYALRERLSQVGAQ